MSSPFASNAFSRLDESEDTNFYIEPRFVVHIDDHAISSVTNVLRTYLSPDSRVLDLMSSYRSHLPSEISYQEVVGLGMNPAEMAANPQLTRCVVQNLNLTSTLPFSSAQFNLVSCAVSVQYLTQPVAIFQEVARVLKPGGVFVVTFSNRMFPTKAVRIWREGDDEEHISLVLRYFELAGAYQQLDVARFVDKTSSWFQVGHDPLFAVIGKHTSSYL